MPSFHNEFTYRRYLDEGQEDEFDRLFDEAVARVKRDVLGKRFPMKIGGKDVYASEELTEVSPIDGTLIGRFQKGNRDHARQAIAAALSSFEGWKNTDYKERARIMANAAGLFRERKFDVAAILSIENGKTRHESVGEVDEAIDFLNYYAEEIVRNKGYVRKVRLAASARDVGSGFQGSPGKEELITVAMKPYGVFGVIAPFNFPVSLSTGMSSGPLVTGNTVVFKPSSTDNMTMLTGLKIWEIFSDAGVPGGAFNYVTGPGSEIGDELAISKDTSGIVFTGSRATGMSMIRKTYDLGMQKVFVVEMGGKNPAIVSKHADIDEAVDGVSAAAFGYAGQKCSACSRVYVQESIKEEFISKLVDKLRTMKIGNPLDKGVYIGPLISGRALEKYASSIEEARRIGRVIYGGNAADVGLKGAYVEPAVIEVEHSSRLMHEELFVPILSVDTFKKFEEAMLKANDVEYGLTAGMYSRNRKEASAFAEGIMAGVAYINRKSSATTGAIVGMHTFVGWKGSGLTGKGTGSKFYLQQFLREQSISSVRK
ncbi:D-glyceraldehyde dehydrogenase (NADP(+)) [uncultured archaeon]|nr:D-glyceraldehyde dehydrogenase (NADP(+)) [uncultured archaeon]